MNSDRDVDLSRDAIKPLDTLEAGDRDALNLYLFRQDRNNFRLAQCVRSGGMEVPPDCSEDDLEMLGMYRRDLFMDRMQSATPESHKKLESQIKPAQLTSPFQSGHRSNAGDECES